MAKYTKRQKEALDLLKSIDSQIKAIGKYAPNKDDYPDQSSYRSAVNEANRQYWKDHPNATEGVTIGELNQRLVNKRNKLTKLMGGKKLISGSQLEELGLTPLTDSEKVEPNTIHLGIGPAKTRRKYPLLKIRKRPGSAGGLDNPFYVYKHDKAAIAKDDKEYKMLYDDYVHGTDGPMTESAIDAAIQQDLSNWNYRKVGGINYKPGYQDSNTTDQQAVSATQAIKIRGKEYSGQKDKGLERWTGRGSGRSLSQADADTVSLLISKGVDPTKARNVDRGELSRLRISGFTLDNDKFVEFGDNRTRLRVR